MSAVPTGHTGITLSADITGPVDRGTIAYFGVPVSAYLGKVVGEDIGCAGTIRPVHYGYRRVGKGQPRVKRRYLRVVPVLYCLQVDFRQDIAGKLDCPELMPVRL